MKDVEFMWTEKCEQTFLKLKNYVTEAPILRGPNWELSFHIATDTSDMVLGAILGQLEDKNPDAIYYISKNITPAELKFNVTEK